LRPWRRQTRESRRRRKDEVEVQHLREDLLGAPTTAAVEEERCGDRRLRVDAADPQQLQRQVEVRRHLLIFLLLFLRVVRTLEHDAGGRGAVLESLHGGHLGHRAHASVARVVVSASLRTMDCCCCIGRRLYRPGSGRCMHRRAPHQNPSPPILSCRGFR
jgi:hypothetical protein